jgi:transcriptional regulator with XRE-family HTH domain
MRHFLPLDAGVNKQTFGQRIRQLRDSRRLTLERLGSMARVSPSTIIRVESKPVGTIRPGTLEEVIVAINDAEALSEKEIDEILHLAQFNHAQARGIKSRLRSRRILDAADPAEERAQLTMECVIMTSRLVGLAGVQTTHKMLSNLLSGFEVQKSGTEHPEVPVDRSVNTAGREQKVPVPPGAIAYPVATEPGWATTIVQAASVPVKRARREEKAG